MLKAWGKELAFMTIHYLSLDITLLVKKCSNNLLTKKMIHKGDMVRSARLVVDTGIHSFGWSKEKAVNYLLENSALTKENAEADVRR